MKKKVADFVDMEQRSGSMQLMTSEYVARCMQISLEDVTEVLKALKKIIKVIRCTSRVNACSSIGI
ncbi:hypothetical protein ACMSDS_03120 [Bacteroides thetaiotaomicron]|uniref:hypothetical protein n=1 Tax=Bacteroides thetaiotaomicron TaxID=818 RepID=UPI0039C06107